MKWCGVYRVYSTNQKNMMQNNRARTTFQCSEEIQQHIKTYFVHFFSVQIKLYGGNIQAAIVKKPGPIQNRLKIENTKIL